MIACPILVTLAITALAGSDPAALVRQLGAAKYAERQAAALEIQKLGADALPTLRAARSASDPEIRSRAEYLVSRIENDLMVRPTLVELDFRDTPLGQVLATLGDRGHAKLRLAASSQASSTRRITVTSDQPVPFWEAIARVAEAGGLELVGGIPAAVFGPNGPQTGPLVFFSSPATVRPVPVSVSGPFRLTLLNVFHHKERTFNNEAPTPVLNGMGINGRPPNNGFVMPQIGRAQVEGTAEQFQANLQIMAEPRMSIAISGPPRLVEAVDDLGHSLLPLSPSGETVFHHSGYNQLEMPQSSVVQVPLPLRFPDRAGKTIQRLKGTVPIVVTARKEDPMMIPLAGPKGQMYHSADVGLTIHDVGLDANSGQTIIELSIRPNSGLIDPSSGLFGQGFPMMRGSNSPQSPFDIVDANGRLIQWQAISPIPMAEGFRLTIRLMSAPGASPATHLRYHEVSRVNTEAEFDFLGIEMP